MSGLVRGRRQRAQASPPPSVILPPNGERGLDPRGALGSSIGVPSRRGSGPETVSGHPGPRLLPPGALLPSSTMEPVRTSACDMVYRGPTPEIGDLHCQRIRPGTIRSFWRPSEADLAILLGGGPGKRGAVELTLHTEPIPPISITVLSAEATEPVGEHPFKVPDHRGHQRSAPAQPKPGPPQPPDHGKQRRHG